MSTATLQRLKENCQRGEFYEALQQYKVHLARLVNMNKRDPAVEFLASGVTEMLSHGQIAMATELASLLAEAFTKMHIPYDAAAVRDIRRVLSPYVLLPSEAPSHVTERLEVLRTIYAWKHSDKTPRGEGSLTAEEEDYLNEQLGLATMAQRDYKSARRFWMNTAYMDRLAECVGMIARENSPVDTPFYYARVTLEILCMAKEKGVVKADAFLRCWPPAAVGSLVGNCVDSVLCTLGRGGASKADAKAFHAVKGFYQPVLGLDPALGKLMSRIESLHFGTGGTSSVGFDMLSAFMSGAGGAGKK